jgi:hypothetical protein
MRGFARSRTIQPSARLAASLAAVALLIGAVFAPAVGAAGSAPSAGTANVNGSPTEWALGADHFADMSATGTTMGDLYLRYDCDSETLYALVLARDGFQARQTRPENAYLRIDGTGKLVSGLSGDDGTPPDFAWVNGDGTLAAGYEASGSLAPGTYTLRAHILIADDSADGYTPIDSNGPLVIECAVATPTPTATPTATPKGTPAGGGVGPITGTPKPATGNVGGVQGRPRVTLPPTDLGSASVARDDSLGVRAVLLGTAALIGALLVLTPPSPRRSRKRNR